MHAQSRNTAEPLARANGATALEALIAALSETPDEAGTVALEETGARSSRLAREKTTHLIQRRRDDDAAATDEAHEAEGVEPEAQEAAEAPNPEDAIESAATSTPQTETEAVESAPQCVDRSRLKAPYLGPTPRDADGDFDVNAYFDEIGVVYEAAASPPSAPGGDHVMLPLDATRAARLRAEAQEAGCPTAAVLATAIDLYFSMLRAS